jgi:hypothetical protein
MLQISPDVGKDSSGLLSSVMNIDHLSVSMLQMFQSCPYCWVEKYLYKKPFPYYEPFDVGRKYHKHVDRYHTGKGYDKKLIKDYTAVYGKDYRVQSEKRFKKHIKIGSWTSPLPFIGVVDGIRESEIVDLKLAKAKPSHRKNIQSLVYSALYLQNTNKMPIFTFNWVNKNNMQVKNVSATHTEKELEYVIEVVDRFMQDINQSIAGIKAIEPKGFNSIHYESCPRYKYAN